MEVKIHIASGCEAVKKIANQLGETFDAYEICLTQPGTGPLYEFAQENFPVHAACPVLSGITKCVEAECKLALKNNVSIEFDV